MSFWGFVAILAILSVMAGALYISKLAAEKEQALRDLRKRVRILHRKIIDTDELIRTLMIYDRNIELLNIFANSMNELINQGLKLQQDSENIRSDLINLQTIKNEIHALSQSLMAPETPASDRQIFLLKKQFIRALRELREMQNKGEIDQASAAEHINRLTKNSLQLEVNAYQIQGHEAQLNGEINIAANFYKHAKELLLSSDLSFDGKTSQIQDISRKISSLYVTLPEESAEKIKDESS